MDLPVSGYQEWSDDTVPFICWDRQWTVADIQRRLKCAQGVARHRLMAWLMRELKTSEVWAFLQPTEIQRELEGISRWLDLDGVMRLCAEAIGANLELRRDAPTFRRYQIIRGDDREIVDIVLDIGSQIDLDTPWIDDVRVDTLHEIVVNKITTLISRCELKDIVDLCFLEKTGFRHSRTSRQTDCPGRSAVPAPEAGA